METKLKVGICAGILIIISAVGGYFFADNTKTPEYTLEVVQESIIKHDKETFYEYVDIDKILETSYGAMIEGVTDSHQNLTSDARDAIKSFTEMIKTPILVTLKATIDSYIETGTFIEEDSAGVADILKRTGLGKTEFRGTGAVELSKNDSEATADIKVYHPEIGREFTLKFILTRTDGGDWKITGIKNFGDFTRQIVQVKRGKLAEYLSKSAEITSRHDTIIKAAEKKYGSILSAGSLANTGTREKLKAVMSDEIKSDWVQRRQELSELIVPKEAETLQRLRLKICDLQIEYAEGYAQWMDDKFAATVKAADEKRRQAQTLMTEVANLAERMKN